MKELLFPVLVQNGVIILDDYDYIIDVIFPDNFKDKMEETFKKSRLIYASDELTVENVYQFSNVFYFFDCEYYVTILVDFNKKTISFKSELLDLEND
jgi:hypothetical protein